jgi:hypothetical protein
MQSTFFLREVTANAEKKVSFLMLSPKQINDTMFSLIKEYSLASKAIIIVSFFTPIIEIKKTFGGKNIYFIDCTQNEEKTDENTVLTTNPSDLTGIMVAIDSIEKKVAGNKIILFDAINMMEAYNEQKKIGRFMHALSNKIRLNENTLIIITIKESTEPKTLELFKQFSDKSYDYSSMYISTIASVETK